MIRVGISYNPNESLFYSGLNQTAVLFAELFTLLKYDVTLVDYTNGDKVWDETFPCVWPTSKLYQTRDLDILLDIDGYVSEAARKLSTKKTIVFLRTYLQFAEMDMQLYIETPYVPRSMASVDEIWCWDILNPPETIPSIQTMFPCPIRRVPFTWSSSVVAHYQKEIKVDVKAPWTIHVAEKNTNNSSSSIIPLVAIRELNENIRATYKIHNMDRIKDNKFLKENVLNNIEFDKLNVSFVDKQPFYEWTANDILFSHTRFSPVRLGLLNALWLGLPVIHNSPFLRDFHPSLKSMYYEGNSIQEIVLAFMHFLENPLVNGVRDALNVFSVFEKQTEWLQILMDFSGTKATTVTPEVSVIKSDLEKDLIIAFDDMWPGFNYDKNFIVDSLRHELNKCNELRNSLRNELRSERSIKGVKFSDLAVKEASLLIFGPYSESWKSAPSIIPRVYFSGENWTHPTDSSIALYISSRLEEDATHMRVPTWMHFIDWFSTEMTLPNNREDNPIRMPLHYALTPHPIPFDQRQKFCAFVVSNPICQMRNEAFQVLNEYKPVSSGGAYQNNIGGQLQLKYPGGGCGDISKHHFFAEHKFTLSFENSQAPGYLTEKLLHAKMAGCVPLYWGTVDTDFNPQSFVNLSQLVSSGNVVDIVKRLEANPAMCAKIAATPPLDEPRKQAALNVISEMCKRLLEIASKPYVSIAQDTSVIDKTYLINLDTRQDRLESFVKVHPDIEFTRVPAINGKHLQMTDAIYQLCKHNTFQWKKSVIACALSHISVWSRIVNDNATYTLILEDDMRFKQNWQKYVKDIPADAELLYLGGVLPTNRHVLPQALEKVNEYWSKLKPNTFFTKEPIAHFHFCAYSYILTKRGAQKLLDYIQYSNDKLCIPCDHLINHPVVGLIKYVTNDLQTFCFQEEDSQYNESQFNELHTEKKFDSDIYNNPECFSDLDLSVYHTATIVKQKIYYIEDKPDLYESTWLEDMFQKPLEFLPLNEENIANSWCLVQRPHTDKWNMILNVFEKQEVPFNVLHLSDEFGTDPIHFYGLSMCKKVVRNYVRPLTHVHIHTIPLGYHHKSVDSSKALSERSLIWSFHGTDWFNRGEQLKQFMLYEPYNCSLQPQWKDPNRTKMTDYLELLGNSKFCPILKGNNMETFRLYEALEAGVLPVAVESNEYTAWIDSHLQLSELYRWTDPAVIQTGVTDEIQKEVRRRWLQWKERVKAICC